MRFVWRCAFRVEVWVRACSLASHPTLLPGVAVIPPHTRTHAHTLTHTHAHTRTHTLTHTHAHTHVYTRFSLSPDGRSSSYGVALV